MRERIAVARSYSVDVSVDEMLKLIDNERDEIFGEQLYEVLDDIKGVSGADYNGHFGPQIFFTIEADFENDETWLAIDNAIEKHIK